MLIENVDQRSKDYSAIKDTYRPGHAGYTYDPPVSVYTSSTYASASGTLVGTAYGSGTIQSISCMTGANPAGSYAYLFCQATNAAGVFFGCYVMNPSDGMIQAVAAINFYSYIAFSANPATGECTGLTVNTGSEYTYL